MTLSFPEIPCSLSTARDSDPKSLQKSNFRFHGGEAPGLPVWQQGGRHIEPTEVAGQDTGSTRVAQTSSEVSHGSLSALIASVPGCTSKCQRLLSSQPRTAHRTHCKGWGKKYIAHPPGEREQNRTTEIVSIQYFWRKLMMKQWLTQKILINTSYNIKGSKYIIFKQGNNGDHCSLCPTSDTRHLS